jgi:cytohesin/brefeldin A-inhibited guanine nucleotide-exchange protein
LEIFPNWETYFDYKKLRPIAFESYRNVVHRETKNHKSKSEKTHFFSCFTTRNSLNPKVQFNFTEQIQESDNFSKKHNQFLLVKLWQIGIPVWVRKTLWPIIIGNRLEVYLPISSFFKIKIFVSI